jgi:class III poly(R)-hydroxyalkanoic acid synthase PhaE subunit
MSDKRDTTQGQGDPFIDWEKITNEYMAPLLNQWGDFFHQPGQQKQSASKGRMAESLLSSAKMWQTMVGAMSGPETLGRFQKATEMTPDIVLGFAQTCLQGFTDVQVQASEWIGKRGASLSEADVFELDKELLENWTETYEKEFSRYLKIPQLGLGRLYQEKFQNATDKLNLFQLELSKFLHMLYLPVEQSLKSLQEQMVEMAEEGPLDEKAKTYYNLWIKLLEGHYMELFKQKEYSDTMNKTLFALHEFSDAKQAVVNDFLKQLNIPTYQEMDELSKEVYLLKKRLRTLEKK